MSALSKCLQNAKSSTRILEAAPCFAPMKHPDGWYPLHAAVLTGEVALVELILTCVGVKVDVEDGCCNPNGDAKERRRDELCGGILEGQRTYRATPLHYACRVGKLDIINLLVEKGASVGAADDKKRTPLEYFVFDAEDNAVLKAYHDMYKKWNAHSVQCQDGKR